MLKDEFNRSDAEDKWRPVGELEEPHKKKRGRLKKEKNNKLETKIKQLEKCIKNKDKRITKMENRWDAIKTTLFSISMVFFIVLLLISIVYIIFTPELHEGFKNSMIAIGVIVTTLFLSWLILFSIIGFVDGYNGENAVCALLMAIIPTMLVTFFVIIIGAALYV